MGVDGRLRVEAEKLRSWEAEKKKKEEEKKKRRGEEKRVMNDEEKGRDAKREQAGSTPVIGTSRDTFPDAPGCLPTGPHQALANKDDHHVKVEHYVSQTTLHS